MTKKVYLQPAIKFEELEAAEQLLAYSVQTSGLDGEDLTEDETPGNTWDDAMSRRKNDWGDEEEEDW